MEKVEHFFYSKRQADRSKLIGFCNYLKEKELSESTISTYLYAMDTYIKSQGEDFSKDKIIEFKWKMLDIKKARTVNIYITAINAYMEYLGKKDVLVKKVKIQKMNSVENVITVGQFEKLINGLKKEGKEKYAIIFEIPAKTGARVSEFLKFTKKDLDNGFAEFFTKGKVRTIYFPKSACEEWKRFFKDLGSDELLVKNKYGKPMTPRGIDQLFKNYAVKYGIPKEVAHIHGLRHYFAKEFLKRNPDITLLADLLGHSGVNTTMIYTRKSKEEQIERLNETVDW